MITQAQFARDVGVTRGAISLANTRQPPLVHIDPETRKIDPDHPLNIAYKNNRVERTSPRQQAANLSKSIAKEISNPDVLKGILKEVLQDITSESTISPVKQESEKNPSPISKQDTISEDSTATPDSDQESWSQKSNANPGNQLKDYDTELLKASFQEKGQKAALENLKIQEKQIKIAALSGELARRDHVETFIGIISGTLSNYFLPLDFRLTATIMDICGVTDPKIKLEISEAIAKETTAGLLQVKKQVEEFALSLNPALSQS